MSSENTNPLGGLNRDLTGCRTVRKGVTVDYHGLRMRVVKARGGTFTGETLVMRKWHYRVPCSMVRVVA